MLSLNVLSIDSASICLISDMVKDVVNSMAVGFLDVYGGLSLCRSK